MYFPTTTVIYGASVCALRRVARLYACCCWALLRRCRPLGHAGPDLGLTTRTRRRPRRARADGRLAGVRLLRSQRGLRRRAACSCTDAALAVPCARTLDDHQYSLDRYANRLVLMQAIVHSAPSFGPGCAQEQAYRTRSRVRTGTRTAIGIGACSGVGWVWARVHCRRLAQSSSRCSS